MIGLGLSIPQVAVRGGGSAPALPLDTVTSAVLAFSIKRKLSTAYTGKLIRVRESGGDTEDDFGADANGDLDTAALESFCGANNGFITKVYEQSGHASAVDYTQTTAANQPQIVASGAVITKDGNVAMQAIDSLDSVLAAAWGTRPSSSTILDVGSYVGTLASNVWAFACDATNTAGGLAASGSALTSVSVNIGTPTYYKNDAIFTQATRGDIWTAIVLDTMILLRAEGADLSNAGWASIASQQPTASSIAGAEYWSERIIISGTDSGDVSAITTNQATAYGITI